MPIDTLHPDYEIELPKRIKVLDALEGEEQVKTKRDEYLPVPPGMGGDRSSSFYEGGAKNTSAGAPYEFYLSFAQFPDMLEATLNGFQGLIHSRDANIELPPQLDYMREDAAPDMSTLQTLWRSVTREVLIGGRVALLADIDTKDMVRLCLYNATSMTNWKPRSAREGGGAEFAVLCETVQVQDDEDPFKVKPLKKYRELRMLKTKNGPTYAAREWMELPEGSDDGEQYKVGPWTVVSSFGRLFGMIPLVSINALTLGFDRGQIPLLPLARLCYSIYRRTADYNRALYVKGDPQPWISGIDENDAPKTIGGNTVWTFRNPAARAEYLDIDGQGIPLMRNAIVDDFEQFDREGGKLLKDKGLSPESGEALKRRGASKQMSLRNIVINAAEGMVEALRYCAKMVGADPMSVRFEPSLEFSEPAMLASELEGLQRSRKDGAPLSAPSLHRLMRMGGLTVMTFEEESSLREKEQEEAFEEAQKLAALAKPDPSGDGDGGSKSDSGAEDDGEDDGGDKAT